MRILVKHSPAKFHREQKKSPSSNLWGWRSKISPPPRWCIDRSRRADGAEMLLLAIVFLQQLPHALMRERRHTMIISASHVVIVDERVDNRFFGRLHGRSKKRIHQIVGN